MATLYISRTKSSKEEFREENKPQICVMSASSVSSGYVGLKRIHNEEELDVFFPRLVHRDEVKRLLKENADVVICREFAQGTNYPYGEYNSNDNISERDWRSGVNITFDIKKNAKYTSVPNYMLGEDDPAEIWAKKYWHNNLFNAFPPNVSVIGKGIENAEGIDNTKTFGIDINTENIKPNNEYKYYISLGKEKFCFCSSSTGSADIVSGFEKVKVEFSTDTATFTSNLAKKLKEKLKDGATVNVYGNNTRIFVAFENLENFYQYKLANSASYRITSEYNSSVLLLHNFSYLRNGEVELPQDYLTLKCKLSGDYYTNVLCEITFPNENNVQVTLSLFDYREVFLGGLDESKEDFIEYLVNENSKLVEMVWHTLRYNSNMGGKPFSIVEGRAERNLISGKYRLICPQKEKVDGDTFSHQHRAIRDSLEEIYLYLDLYRGEDRLAYNKSLYDVVRRRKFIVGTMRNPLEGSSPRDYSETELEVIKESTTIIGWTREHTDGTILESSFLLAELSQRNAFLGALTSLNYASESIGEKDTPLTITDSVGNIALLRDLDGRTDILIRLYTAKVRCHLNAKIREFVGAKCNRRGIEDVANKVQRLYSQFISRIELTKYNLYKNNLDLVFNIHSDRLFVSPIAVDLNIIIG